ncbi:hypothetical protein JHD48_06785 [Sulfurimonas sp. SAG-AH-194-I05]|nr:hypothetical protein [Sulfurimonas sp. SAG-AH-194-I05]MDF1875435.1 hypothetical protein [Sulfurimonas sp. SAG-AH-194-I05]
MQNPFESGHIKNYILAYSSIVVIMVLFFIASTLFLEIEDFEKKVFSTEVNRSVHVENKPKIGEEKTFKFQLMDKAY